MGTILAKKIVNDASGHLNDTDGVRWTPLELLGYLNSGQREIGIHKPDALTVVESVPMVQGSKQALPVTGVRVIDALCNAGATGATEGAAVRVIDREELDTTAGRNWRSTQAATDVEHVVFDGRTPTIFFVHPPQSGSGRHILMAWQKAPTDCTIAGVSDSGGDTTISLNDIYEPSLLEYVLHKAYLKDSDTRDINKASMHYGWFLRRLGTQSAGDKEFDMNRNAAPAQQSRQPGGASQRARAY